MNSPASSPPLSADHSHSHCGAYLAQFSLAAYLVGILGTAIYMVVTGWRATTTSGWVAECLLLFVMPAVVYQMGFFHFIPELLGRTNHEAEARPEGARWSSLLIAAQWIFAPLALAFWALSAGPSDVFSMDATEVYLFTALWVFVAALVCAALRLYLGLPSVNPIKKTSGFPHPLNWLIRRLRPGIALPLGAALVLSSLGLYSSLGSWGDGKYGYRVLAGSAAWMTSQHLPSDYERAGQMLFCVGRSFYVLGVSLAAVTAFLWIRARIRRTHVFHGGVQVEAIKTLSVLIVMFVISDLFFGFLAFDQKLPARAVHEINVLRMAYWLVPLGLGSARKLLPALKARWGQWKGAFIILYLPLVLANSAVLALVTMLGAIGYGAFLLGMLLLAWGFVQLDSESPMRGKGEVVETLS